MIRDCATHLCDDKIWFTRQKLHFEDAELIVNVVEFIHNRSDGRVFLPVCQSAEGPPGQPTRTSRTT